MILWVQIKPFCKVKFLYSIVPFAMSSFYLAINKIDFSWLQNESVMDYLDGDRVKYVSSYNNLDEVLYLCDDIQAF